MQIHVYYYITTRKKLYMKGNVFHFIFNKEVKTEVSLDLFFSTWRKHFFLSHWPVILWCIASEWRQCASSTRCFKDLFLREDFLDKKSHCSSSWAKTITRFTDRSTTCIVTHTKKPLPSFKARQLMLERSWSDFCLKALGHFNCSINYISPWWGEGSTGSIK